MIVQKPQFDQTKIEPGMFVIFKGKRYSIFEDYQKGIIFEVHPFRLEVKFYNVKKKCLDQTTLNLDDQLSKDLMIYIPELVSDADVIKSGHNPLSLRMYPSGN